MRTLFVLGLLAATVLSLGGLASSATAGCVIDCKARCIGHNTVELSWVTTCDQAICRVTSTTISRSCFANGPWTVIAKEPTSPYFDHPPGICPTPNTYYRIDITWECGPIAGHSTCETGPISCP